MLEVQHWLPKNKLGRLEGSWAGIFRAKILPLIDEEVFRDCFHQKNGRPNKSIRDLICLHLLKEGNDLTDEEVLDLYEFNLQWHYALGVESGSAHICQKTLHNFRHRMMQNKRAQETFVVLTKGLVEADGLSVVKQRMDSTHVLSNIAVLTRLGLFVETVSSFLRELRRAAPNRLAALSSEYAKRYLDREGYFADAKRDLARRRLPVVATDVFHLVQFFRADPAVSELDAYRLLARLLEEQCRVILDDLPEAGVERVELKEPRDISSASLQSPYDPDATYGHKGKGYETQIVETCGAENPYQVVTDVALNGANVSDQTAVVPAVERLTSNGLKPEELTADTGYGSGENIVACAELGVSLLAPVQDPERPASADRWEAPVTAYLPLQHEPVDEPVSAASPTPSLPPDRAELSDFTFSPDFRRVQACPAGHAPVSQKSTYNGRRLVARFDPRRCAACPLAASCPVRSSRRGDRRELQCKPSEAATARRQRQQQTTTFKEAYKIRSGIESTNSVLKGPMGADDLRVRGEPRVALTMILKTMALNIHRCTQHHLVRFKDRLDSAACAQTCASNFAPACAQA
jgi:hypothetical protein